MPFVEILKGPDQKRYYPIAGGETFGRGPENDIQLFAQGISRVHFQIVFEDGQFAVVDKRSSNGTKLNGDRVRRAPIVDGDTIRAGNVEMRFGAGACPENPLESDGG